MVEKIDKLTLKLYFDLVRPIAKSAEIFYQKRLFTVGGNPVATYMSMWERFKNGDSAKDVKIASHERAGLKCLLEHFDNVTDFASKVCLTSKSSPPVKVGAYSREDSDYHICYRLILDHLSEFGIPEDKEEQHEAMVSHLVSRMGGLIKRMNKWDVADRPNKEDPVYDLTYKYCDLLNERQERIDTFKLFDPHGEGD